MLSLHPGKSGSSDVTSRFANARIASTTMRRVRFISSNRGGTIKIVRSASAGPKRRQYSLWSAVL
jgi:hypothetical protein